MSNIVKVQSHSDPDVYYEVDTVNKTCTCPAFTKSKSKKPCKHMASLTGMLADGPKRPTYSPAVSALIKAVRMRNAEDTAIWYHYLCTFPEATYKLQRRVVLIAAEDNFCIDRMEKVRVWWDSYRDSKIKALGNMLAICRTHNWWSLPIGQYYFLNYHKAEKAMKDKELMAAFHEISTLELEKLLLEALEDDEAYLATLYSEVLWARPRKSKNTMDGWDMFEFLKRLRPLAEAKDSKNAIRLIDLMEFYGKVIWGDSNYWGQVLYQIMFNFEVADGQIKGHEVKDYVELAREYWKDPKPIPSHYLDGIHTGGSDPRFAGTIRSMAGCCRAYREYGRLIPEDPWPGHIWTGAKDPDPLEKILHEPIK